jgi:hypothetical protein
VVRALDFCAGEWRRRLLLLAMRSAEGGVLVPGPQRDGLSCGARAGCIGWLVGLLGEGARRTVMRASAWAMAGESSTLAAQLMNSSSMSSNLFFAMPTPPPWSP